MTCGHCGATVPADGVRCPKCLRKSGVLPAGEPPPVRERAPSEPVRGVRAILLFVALLIVFAIVLTLFRVFVLPD